MDRPSSIYESIWISGGRWRKYSYLTYSELAEKLVAYVKDMNFTHVELIADY
jgi:1,4-alpha-glucan branching enzyme